jgi:hypothetical protein
MNKQQQQQQTDSSGRLSDMTGSDTRELPTKDIDMTVLDTFRTPKRVCSQFPFPRLGFSMSTGSGASQLATPTRRQKDVDHTVDPLIVAAFAASSTTTFPFHTKYSSQAWGMGTGNNPVSARERWLLLIPYLLHFPD